MRLTYKYRIKANKETISKTERWLDLCRFVYNCALSQRIMWYKQGKKSLSYIDQQNQLVEAKQLLPELKEVNAQTIREPIKRLDLAFQAFFRRVKQDKEKAGFPRFKGKNRYDSFTFPEYSNGYKLEGNNLIISKLGIFKIKFSRPIEGDIKTLIICKSPTGKWFACFSCDNVPAREYPEATKEIGIDVGLKSFCVDSEGKQVKNPKYFRLSERLLRIRYRTLNRCKKGSVRRNKSRILVAKAHETVNNQRKDFLHKLSKEYVRENKVIYIENLNIGGMKQNKHLSKSIGDASWGMFFNFLSYKAEEAGRLVVKVNPNGTSQICSCCGSKVPKTLAVRVHNCPFCGLIEDRDLNAARNILKIGISNLHGSGSYALTSALAGVA